VSTDSPSQQHQPLGSAAGSAGDRRDASDGGFTENLMAMASEAFARSLSRQFELVRADIAHVARLTTEQQPDEDDRSEEIAMLQGEIGRLRQELNTHRDGVIGATTAGLDVLGERARQRRWEGYDDAHDDKHQDFALTSAAISYLMDARLRGTTGHGFGESPPPDWPWEVTDWKTKKVRQSLVVAAALILADIERLDRAGVNA
jgi:HAMP domain-containing protein